MRSDVEVVADLLGREPNVPFTVARRDAGGVPVVIELARHTTSGAPQGTWFWLVDRELVKAVSRLEARGGVKLAELAISRSALSLANLAHKSCFGRPIASSRNGVKCLHAHVALALSDGFSPVGIWALYKIVSQGLISVYDLSRLGLA
jgi:hypothetical protein